MARLQRLHAVLNAVRVRLRGNPPKRGRNTARTRERQRVGPPMGVDTQGWL